MSEYKNNLTCMICGCYIHRDGDYAKPTLKGRSHATRHHYVPERFFGRSSNRPNTLREPIIKSQKLMKLEGKAGWFCYECHEELLHNPILIPEDVIAFAHLVKSRGLSEENKSDCRDNLASRIELLQEVLHKGIIELLEENAKSPEVTSNG